MRRSIVATTVAALLFTVTACGGRSSPAAGDGCSRRRHPRRWHRSRRPARSQSARWPLSGPEDHYYQAVYDSAAAAWTPTGKPAADLATEWSYDAASTDPQPDPARRRHLHRRHDVRRRRGQGEPGEGEGGPPARPAPRSVRSTTWTVVDATHADIVLSAPDPVAGRQPGADSGFMASPKALTSADLATDPVGSGPYVLDQDKTTAGSTYVYTRNADYWDTDAYPYDEVDDQVPGRHHRRTSTGCAPARSRAAGAAASDVVSGRRAGRAHVSPTFTTAPSRASVPLGPGRRDHPGAR